MSCQQRTGLSAKRPVTLVRSQIYSSCPQGHNISDSSTGAAWCKSIKLRYYGGRKSLHTFHNAPLSTAAAAGAQIDDVIIRERVMPTSQRAPTNIITTQCHVDGQREEHARGLRDAQADTQTNIAHWTC